MRKGILGSIAAVAAGAGAAWGQSPVPPAPAGDPPAPAAIAPAGEAPPTGPGSSPGISKVGYTPPAPVIMPPISVGPQGDPQGLGPVAGMGPPPGPMFPNPGPYGAPLFQPAPPGTGAGAGAAYGGAPHWWVSADYLLYFSKSQPSNFPLLTTSAPSDAGRLGQASTLVLAGGKDFSYNPFSGFRVTSGFYGDADRRYGFEASGFVVEQKSNVTSVAASPTSSIPVLARPFIDSTNLGAFTSLVIATPGLGGGQAIVGTSSQAFGVEANGLLNIYRSEPGSKFAWSLDLLAGYRYFQLTEDISINSSTDLALPNTTTPIFASGPFGILTQIGTTTVVGSTSLGGVTVFNPSTILIQDMFKVTNRFNGGQVGFRSEARYGMFSLALTGKLALGHMQERLEISGASGFIDPVRGRVGTAYGGLLANASNIGRYNHDEFTVIPEANINLGINVTRGLTAFVGYNFLYVNNVARPGSQINPIVNTATVPFSPNYGASGRPIVPQSLFAQDDYWLMGVNFGFMLRY